MLKGDLEVQHTVPDNNKWSIPKYNNTVWNAITKICYTYTVYKLPHH